MRTPSSKYRFPRLPASNEFSQYLQDEHIGKREVSEGTVDGAEQRRVVDLGANACQAEDREPTVVPFVLEVVGVPPYERHSQVRQRHLGCTRLAAIPETATKLLANRDRSHSASITHHRS